MSGDVDDLLPLTPNHLLNFKGTAGSLGEFSSEAYYAKSRWKQVQHMSEIFWNRWKREYMTTLQSRQKWTQEKKNIEFGDVVLVTDESLPRCHWALGRVSGVKSSQDGLVRSVHVICKHKVLERPIGKIVKLVGRDDQ